MKNRTTPAVNKRRKAYSYSRFSDPQQAEGDSLRRQTRKARDYADRHNLDLDESLCFRDLGVSAYRGKNAEAGKLGEFLEAVQSGVIKQGSVLLVENFDRLSRLPPMDALNLFNDILKLGVNVVLIDHGKEFSEDTLRDEPMALISLVFMACHGNEEQNKKGGRLRDRWAEKKEQAAKSARARGTKKTAIITAMAPCWLKPNGNKDTRTGWIVDKTKAKIVKRIFDLTLKGVGVNKLAMDFNEKGVPAIGRPRKRRKDAAGPDMSGKWYVSFIQKLLANPAVIGEFRDHKREYNHKTRKYTRSETGEVIKGYYPAIIKADVFKKVAEQMASRKGRNAATGKSFGKARAKGGRISNMFAGLSRCPLCEATMSSVNKGNGSKVYLACSRAKVKARCRPYHAVKLEDVEAAFISAAWAGDFIRNVPTGNQKLDKELEAATEEVEHYGVVLMETKDAWREQPSNFLAAEIRKLEREEQEAQARWRDLSARAESADHTILEKRAQELRDVLPAPFGTIGKDGKETPAPANKEAINAVLHRIFDHVVIDYLTGNLVIHWRNGAKTRIKYDKPLKRQKAAA